MSVVTVDGLVKRYAGRAVVDGVSFDVAAGEIFGILGPNGAGKTTTVECIEGLRSPDAGTIRVTGLDPQADGHRLRHLMGVQLQQSRLQAKLKVGEALDLYASFYDDPVDGNTLLDTLGLAGQRKTTFEKLSGGQQQRLSIALALVGRPKVAVLDELTTGLDPQARRETWALIEQVRDSGVTVLLVTHFMEEAQRLCDRLAIIDAGRIVTIGSPDAIVARAGQGQRMRFVPSASMDPSDLEDLDAVSSVAMDGDRLIVSGTDDVVAQVVAWLANKQIIAQQLRVDQPSLDDAFVALTGRPLDPPADPVNGEVHA